jgi:hypothetical protein
LFDQSIAAHGEARRLDPNVPTSVEQTVMMTGDVDRLLSLERILAVSGADGGIRVIGLGLAGRREEARRMLDELVVSTNFATFNAWRSYLTAWLEMRLDDMRLVDSALNPLKIADDPEAIFQRGWLLCDVGDYEGGLEYLQRAIKKGYFVVPALLRSQFDGIREHAAFRAVFAEAEAGRRQALAAFRDAGGERLLGTAGGT